MSQAFIISCAVGILGVLAKAHVFIDFCRQRLKASFRSEKLSMDWNGQENFLCVKVISSNPELTRQRKIFLSVPIHG